MRRGLAVVVMLAVLGACAGASEDVPLEERIVAAGVFSPQRLQLGNDDAVLLGQLLFFDKELSGNRDVACATCHLPALHAVDQLALARGQGSVGLGVARAGRDGPRSTLPPFNRSFATALLWDGRVEELPDGTVTAPVPLPAGIRDVMEAQTLLPLIDRFEMRGDRGDAAADGRPNELAVIGDDDPAAVWSAVVARIVALEGYRDPFLRAYPDVPFEAITIEHVVRAIVAFERRIWELIDTPFDGFLARLSDPSHPDREEILFPDEAVRGADLFFGDAGCHRCHDGPLLSDMGFHNIGVPPVGPGTDGNGLDVGREAVTGDPADRFAFRTPPLRNVALTAPYMHDGAFDSLDAALRHHLDPDPALGARPPPFGVATHDDDDVLLERIRAGIDPDVRPLRPLDEQEILALVVFLEALTSQVEIVVDSAAGVPESVPSGLPVDRL